MSTVQEIKNSRWKKNKNKEKNESVLVRKDNFLFVFLPACASKLQKLNTVKAADLWNLEWKTDTGTEATVKCD